MIRRAFRALLAGVALVGPQLAAEPIAPVGLRQLYVEAPTVVLAKVERLDSGPDPGKTAVLRVEEVWKGPLLAAQVKVACFRFSCPADAAYRPGQMVLAFLESDTGKAEPGTFRTCGLSYGAMEVTPEQAAVFRQRLSELRGILALASPAGRAREMTNWLLRCVLDPATRVPGLIELSESHPEFRREKPDDEVQPIYWKKLSLSQLDELVRILPDDSGTLATFSLGRLMEIIAQRSGSPALAAARKRYVELEWDYETLRLTKQQAAARAEYIGIYRRWRQSND